MDGTKKKNNPTKKEVIKIFRIIRKRLQLSRGICWHLYNDGTKDYDECEFYKEIIRDTFIKNINSFSVKTLSPSVRTALNDYEPEWIKIEDYFFTLDTEGHQSRIQLIDLILAEWTTKI